MTKNQCEKLFINIIDEMNSMLPQDKHISKNLDSLFENLDSLQLVNFIVSVEETLEEKLNQTITLTDVDNSSSGSPLESIESLSNFIIKSFKNK